MYSFNKFDHNNIKTIEYVKSLLENFKCHTVLIKELPKNANDKNQVYIHSDISFLNSIFNMSFNERGVSSSQTKRSSNPGKKIPEATFINFSWLDKEGVPTKTKSCKAIVYTQYPETRLSGFITVDGDMPRSMSVEYTKRPNIDRRFLIIGADINGVAYGIMVVNPDINFINEFKEIPLSKQSKVCKIININNSNRNYSQKLEEIFKKNISEKTLLGCRFDKSGNTIPFNGTQVHGYTLEHACGIKPNSDKNGDIFGIELKCFTNKKLTLFTPEPDGGVYHSDFKYFMTKYGYIKDNCYRVTGLHKAYIKNEKSNLTLKITCLTPSKSIDSSGKKITSYNKSYFDPKKPITLQMTELKVILEDNDGNIAASWSVERLMNCWGAKHNEVVYVPAEKLKNTELATKSAGFDWKIKYSNLFLWCKTTNVEKLFHAIHNGTIYLDPAPKYNPNDAKMSKRRSQWRINDIYKSASLLYSSVELKTLQPLSNPHDVVAM